MHIMALMPRSSRLHRISLSMIRELKLVSSKGRANAVIPLLVATRRDRSQRRWLGRFLFIGVFDICLLTRSSDLRQYQGEWLFSWALSQSTTPMRYLSWLLSFFRWTQRRGCIDEIVEHCCTVIQNGVLVTATVTKAKMDKIV